MQRTAAPSPEVPPSEAPPRAARPRLTLTIFHKLIAMTVALMIAVVGALTWYFSSQQIDEMAAALRTKATTYGAVMASQASSAVAFADRETAREVLSSIDADPDVASVTLTRVGGPQLYRRGAALSTDAAAGDAPRVVELATRIAVFHPVISLEGPRGVLAIELSTSSLEAARGRVHRLAVQTGLAALAAGAIAAWLIARRLARRLRAIASVASAVAAGDLEQAPIRDPQRDEIGTLAAAFNAMLAQIKQLIAQVQALAREEQARLAALVAERTAQLDRRNAEMRHVLDHVDQGLCMIELDGTLATERSAAVARLLGPAPEAATLQRYLAQVAPASAAWFELQWDALREGVLPAELCLAQLPARLAIGERHLDLAYKRVEIDGQARVLLVVSDVTAQTVRCRAERAERETAALLASLLRGRAAFLAFHAEVSQYVAALAGALQADPATLRAVHTLKGIAALAGLSSIAEPCHALETALGDGEAALARRHADDITARWAELDGKLAPVMEATANRLELEPDDLTQLEAAVRRGAPPRELLALVDSWRRERIEQRLRRLADEAQLLAERLGKAPIDVALEVERGLRMPAGEWDAFWSTFSHAVRNAIDHGIEPPAERAAAGKPAVARLALRAAHAEGELAVELEDQGRGVDWAAIRDRARARALPSESHDDLVAALCHDGLSTRDAATETSGRGVGMSALRAAVHSSGGTLSISSRAGLGTTIAVRWPLAPAAEPRIARLSRSP